MEFRVGAGLKQLHFGGALVPPVRHSPMDTVMVQTSDLLPGWQLCLPPPACGVSPPRAVSSRALAWAPSVSSECSLGPQALQ